MGVKEERQIRCTNPRCNVLVGENKGLTIHLKVCPFGSTSIQPLASILPALPSGNLSGGSLPLHDDDSGSATDFDNASYQSVSSNVLQDNAWSEQVLDFGGVDESLFLK